MDKDGQQSLFRIIGASNHAETNRENDDYYATDPIATEYLITIEKFHKDIWEPAAGQGHISKVLMNNGYNVYSTDLKYRGFGNGGINFLHFPDKWDGDIITNPPYYKAKEFVEKALELIPDGNKVAMFLKLTFLEGKERKHFFRKYPPYKIWVSSSRIKCAINGDFEGTGTSAIAYGWFIWVKGFIGETKLDWFN